MGERGFAENFRVIVDTMSKMKLENPRRYSRFIKFVAGIATTGVVTGVLAGQAWLYAKNKMMDVVAQNGIKQQIDEVNNEFELLWDKK